MTDLSPMLEGAAAVLAGGGGLWAGAKAYLKYAQAKVKLTESQGNNHTVETTVFTDLQKSMMQQQQDTIAAVLKATDKVTERQELEAARREERHAAEIMRMHERLTSTESSLRDMQLELARVGAELKAAVAKADRYAKKLDAADERATHAETLVESLRDELASKEARIVELESEVAALKAAAGDPGIHAHKRASDPPADA